MPKCGLSRHPNAVGDPKVVAEIVAQDGFGPPPAQLHRLDATRTSRPEQTLPLHEGMVWAGYRNDDGCAILGGNRLRLAREAWKAHAVGA